MIDKKRENNIEWLGQWYNSNCDGDWEHNFGIKIETIDNPGWSIEIDTQETNFHQSDIAWTYAEEDEDNWFGYKVENGKFEASGAPSKLSDLIGIFREIAMVKN